jgi:hypothetical protein
VAIALGLRLAARFDLNLAAEALSAVDRLRLRRLVRLCCHAFSPDIATARVLALSSKRCHARNLTGWTGSRRILLGGKPLRTLVAIAAAACCIAAPVLAQSVKPRTVYVQVSYEGEKPFPYALVIPAGSPLRLASDKTTDIQASFVGRFTLSGTYRIEGYGEETSLTFWPDRKSRDSLPHWKGRDVPEEIDISDAWAFAQAVVPKARLARLEAKTLGSVRGRVTILADHYETSIDCDAVSAAAHFVSVVKPTTYIAALPANEESC